MIGVYSQCTQLIIAGIYTRHYHFKYDRLDYHQIRIWETLRLR